MISSGGAQEDRGAEGGDAAAQNRAAWDRISDAYQSEHGAQLGTEEVVWGGWSLPERELQVLGDVRGKDILELGCGAAQFSIKLARLGANCVGVDLSQQQLAHGRALVQEAGVNVRLIEASGTDVPLPNASFDIVFCDYGAFTWADPYLAIPEASRLLRVGGLLAFNMSSPFVAVCSRADEAVTEQLQRPYFGMHSSTADWGAVAYQLPYGDWIRLLQSNGLDVEDLIELRPPPGATTTYEGWVPLPWARRWPSENIWKARKAR
jgi:SAM-dependent methyltransferase